MEKRDGEWRCACGFTGRFQQVQGHRAHSKTPACDAEPEKLIPDPPPEGAEDDDQPEVVVPEGPQHEAGPEVIERSRTTADSRSKSVSRTVGPTPLKETVYLPAYFRAMYDGVVNNWDYEGTFTEFIIECCLEFWEMNGWKIELTVRFPNSNGAAQMAVTAAPGTE